jgi:DNA invertase Pin-like site-specific DNA recombinase
MTDFIAYYRVSTDKQGKSGLGLEAQKDTVKAYVRGCGGRLTDELIEVESGKRSDNRPKLTQALRDCHLKNRTLIIAKLDRLSRNVAFIAALMESGVEFVAVDFPTANKLTIHVLAAVAEHEREAISKRTIAALAAAKARGKRLGNPALLPGSAEAAASARAARTKAVDAKASQFRDIIADLRGEGRQSLRELAEGLNGRGFPAPRGGDWRAQTVRRLLDRLDAAP